MRRAKLKGLEGVVVPTGSALSSQCFLLSPETFHESDGDIGWLMKEKSGRIGRFLKEHPEYVGWYGWWCKDHEYGGLTYLSDVRLEKLYE